MNLLHDEIEQCRDGLKSSQEYLRSAEKWQQAIVDEVNRHAWPDVFSLYICAYGDRLIVRIHDSGEEPATEDECRIAKKHLRELLGVKTIKRTFSTGNGEFQWGSDNEAGHTLGLKNIAIKTTFSLHLKNDGNCTVVTEKYEAVRYVSDCQNGGEDAE